MNKTSLLLLNGFLFLSSFNLIAQPAKAKMQELKAQKRAFVQKEAQLTDAEMKTWEDLQKNQRQAGMEGASNRTKQQKGANRLSQTSIESMTDAQAEALLSERIANAEKAMAVRKASIESAQKQLGAKKVLRIQLAEKQWRRELLKKIKEQRGEMPAQEDSDDLD